MKKITSLDTIENTHSKFTSKVKLLRAVANDLRTIAKECIAQASSRDTKKHIETATILGAIDFDDIIQRITALKNNYLMAMTPVLSNYYCTNNVIHTAEYYQILTSNNFESVSGSIAWELESIRSTIGTILPSYVIDKKIIARCDSAINKFANVHLSIFLNRKNYEICKCGGHMTMITELSELHCDKCARIKHIVGSICRDDHTNNQETTKTKQNGYDTMRHYKFWMERIQACEKKVFSQDVLDKIESIIKRDRLTKANINCKTMRAILADCAVKRDKLTNLNEHVPLLVVHFGGRSPPLLDFNENRACQIRFNKVMDLYNIVNPDGRNVPYYPFFIYKILQHMLRGNREKLRILQYIHLQKRETVIKNDLYYKEICELSDPEDDLVYVPTDLSGG